MSCTRFGRPWSMPTVFFWPGSDYEFGLDLILEGLERMAYR